MISFLTYVHEADQQPYKFLISRSGNESPAFSNGQKILIWAVSPKQAVARFLKKFTGFADTLRTTATMSIRAIIDEEESQRVAGIKQRESERRYWYQDDD